MQPDTDEEKTMPFLDHLEELRRQLVGDEEGCGSQARGTDEME